MPDAWFLDDCAIETRMARCVAGRLAGVWLFPKIESSPRARVGEIYLARLGARRPGAGGVFLDLATSGEGFLRESAAKLPPEGSLVLATVAQEAVAGKAPRLTAGVRLKGRTAVLAWDGNERFETRLADVRITKTERTLLRSDLSSILARASSNVPGRVGGAPSATRRLVSLARPGDRVVIASAELLNEARTEIERWGPELSAGIEPASAKLFEDEGIEAGIESTLEPVVALASGGRLIIEMTAALTAIDIDAGVGRAADANDEAARAIPLEIAARRLAGTILIDFAQVRERGTLSHLGAVLRESAAQLGLKLEMRAGHRGLFDIRRPRAEAPLAAELTRTGLTHRAVPRTLSFPAQAARIARAVEGARPASRWEVRVPAATHSWLHGDGSAFRKAMIAATPARLVFTAAELSAADGYDLVG